MGQKVQHQRCLQLLRASNSVNPTSCTFFIIPSWWKSSKITLPKGMRKDTPSWEAIILFFKKLKILRGSLTLILDIIKEYKMLVIKGECFQSIFMWLNVWLQKLMWNFCLGRKGGDTSKIGRWGKDLLRNVFKEGTCSSVHVHMGPSLLALDWFSNQSMSYGDVNIKYIRLDAWRILSKLLEGHIFLEFSH